MVNRANLQGPSGTHLKIARPLLLTDAGRHSPVGPGCSPKNECTPPAPRITLLIGKQLPDLEASMATRQHASYKKRGFWGKALVILGSIALVADLAFLAQPLERLAEKLGEGLFGLLPSIGLSFVHAVRAFAFHQIDYFSLISRILVLFTATVALVVGSALLRSPSARSRRTDLLH